MDEENTRESDPPREQLVVVMPAHNAEKIIGNCLRALTDAGLSPQQITVVNDGSSDQTGDIASAAGARVVHNQQVLRPAQARNRGADETDSEWILFVDSDVEVHPDLLQRLAPHLADTTISGVFGCYDDRPRVKTLVGQYRNLLHAFSHQKAAGEVPTFWTGLGMIRREALNDAGGFLSDWEDIEDVELGLRVSQRGGRIVLDPEIKGKHLKSWTLGSMIKTDYSGRAVPWTRLLRTGRMPMGVLATSIEKRVAAVTLFLTMLMLAVGVFWKPALWLAAISALVFVAVNWQFFRYLIRVGGLGFGLASIPLHALHHSAGLAGYAKVTLLERSK